MVELVDTLDLGSSAERRVGSTPSIRTFSFKNLIIYVCKYSLFSNNFKALSDCFALQCHDVRARNLICKINMNLS